MVLLYTVVTSIINFECVLWPGCWIVSVKGFHVSIFYCVLFWSSFGLSLLSSKDIKRIHFVFILYFKQK